MPLTKRRLFIYLVIIFVIVIARRYAVFRKHPVHHSFCEIRIPVAAVVDN